MRSVERSLRSKERDEADAIGRQLSEHACQMESDASITQHREHVKEDAAAATGSQVAFSGVPQLVEGHVDSPWQPVVAFGVTASVHNPGVRMPGTAVGLYCAVVDRFDLLVPTRTMAARETQAVFNQRAESLRRWLRA